MRVSYYPGCTLESTSKNFDHSIKQVCHVLGVELEEPHDWVCCGSTAGLKMNKLVSTALSGLNLAILEKRGPADVMAPCPFCYRRLVSAQEELRQDPKLKAEVQEVIEAQLSGRLQVHNLVDFFRTKVGLPAIAAKARRPLSGLKVVPYYGCYLLKPKQVTGCEDPENPASMDEILRALGAEVLDWDFKTECCGASLTLSKTAKVLELSGRIAREAAFRGADAIVVACQMCQANLDMRQTEVEKRRPVVYFTQLMGLAFGIAPETLGLNHHLVDPVSLLRKKGLIG